VPRIDDPRPPPRPATGGRESRNPFRKPVRGARALLAGVVKPLWRTLALLILLGLPLLAAVALARVITSALWFQEVGQGDVYARIVAARLRLAVGAGGLTAGFLLANAGKVVAHTRARNRRHLMVAAVAASALVGVIVGVRAERHWQLLMLWLHSRHVGAVDPLHHADVGFFVFSLPFLERVAALLLIVAALGLVLTVALYAFSGDVGWRPLRVTPPARAPRRTRRAGARGAWLAPIWRRSRSS
jgi:hypothetical protein